MNEHEIQLARIIANAIAQLDGVPTEVEIEDGYAYVKTARAAFDAAESATSATPPHPSANRHRIRV